MKKLLARLLITTLILQLFSGINLVRTENFEAATDLPIVNEQQVRERIKELAKLLEINNGDLSDGSGIQFTANGGACPSGHATGASTNCTNCLNTNVIKSDWFNIFPLLFILTNISETCSGSKSCDNSITENG